MTTAPSRTGAGSVCHAIIAPPFIPPRIAQNVP